MLSLDEVARLLLVSTLLLTHGLLSLRDVALPIGIRPFAAGCWQQLVKWGQAARAWTQRMAARDEGGAAEEEDDTARAMATLVADAVQQRREVVRRAVLSMILHVCFAIIFLEGIIVLTGVSSLAQWPMFLCFCVCFLLWCGLHHFPGRCPWLSFRPLFLAPALALCLSSVVTPQSIVRLILSRCALLMAPRIVGCIILLDTPFVCSLNIMHSITFVISVHRSEEENPDDFPRLRSAACVAEVFASLAICACSRLFEYHVTTLYRHAIELKAAKSEAYATAKVLNAMCDAVVHLDEHLRVAAADTRLPALLLQGRGCIQAGSNFLHYLYRESARQPFREWLKASPERCDDHVGFEVELRDSAGSAIAVEMFNVPFDTITGASRNFVGIREKVTARRAGPDDGQGQRNDDSVAALRDFAGTRRPARSRRSPPASTSSSASSSYSDPGIEEIDSCLVFQFDVATLEILGYSPGFVIGTYRPPPKGSMLLEEIPQCDVNVEFLRRFDDSAAALVEHSRGSLSPVEVAFDSAIIFALGAHGEQFRLDVHVTLNGSWGPGADPSDQEQLPGAVGTAKVSSVTHASFVSSATTGHRELIRL